MIRVAIVEDSEADAQALTRHLETWQKNHEDEALSCTVYSDAVKFLEYGSTTADIVFMDIEMPHRNGMSAAEEFRKYNPEAILIFATWFTKYAVRGYAVDAIGYLVKPVGEKEFSEVFRKALHLYRERTRDQTVVLKTRDGVVKMNADRIQYIEADAHQLHIYTDDGGYSVWSSVSKILEILPDSFVRCHKGYIVNLKYVYSIRKDGLSIVDRPDVLIPVSRPNRAEFMERLTRYYTKPMRGVRG